MFKVYISGERPLSEKQVAGNLDIIEEHGLIKVKGEAKKQDGSSSNASRSQMDMKSKQFNRREKLLVGFIAFLVIMFITFAVVMGFLYAKETHTTQDPLGQKPAACPCVTKDCVFSASELLNYLDPSVNPCYDFYKFACGGWIKKNPVPPKRELWNQFTKLEEDSLAFVKEVLYDKETQAKYAKLESFQKAIAYHKSCINTQEISKRKVKPLNDIIKKFGSWTITGNEWDEKSWDLVKYLAMMRRVLALGPFFTVFIGADQRNSTINVIQLRPIAMLGLSRRRLTANSTDGRRARGVYREFLLNITTALGAGNTSFNDVMDVYNLEIELAQVMPVGREAYDDTILYERLTVKELNNYTGTNPIDWKEFLHQLFFPVTGEPISDFEEIVVYGVDFLRNITRVLKRTSKRTLANYMMWRAVDSLYLRLGDDFQQIFKDFIISLDGYWATIPREELCLQLMKEKYFDTPLSRIYVDKYFNGDSKKIAKELVEWIRDAFKLNILELEWMDDHTKKAAIDKANVMMENIGFPDYILDDKTLDEEYMDVTCNEFRYFENELSLDQAIAAKELAVYGKPVDDTEWAISPIALNAYYDMLANKMVFPAAILQSPFYNKRYPKAMLFGAVGSIMGHELTHGFDVDGRRFDMNGNERHWWSAQTLSAFNTKTKCLEEQYANFTFDSGTIDGKQTLSENIADNGGIKQAFRAYQEWVKRNGEEPRLPGMNLTHEQVFFISYARNWCSSFTARGEIFALMSEHSPEPWRTNGAVMNFAKFSEAFNCPLGTPMNPIKKCAVW